MPESSQHSAKGRIIFVDEDICMRQMMEIVLSDLFQIVTARSGEEGLVLMESEAPFDIVICSFKLLWMNGVEFLRQAGEKQPHTVRILMSGGCGDTVDINQAISRGHISRLVLKPFCMNTFLDQLENDLAAVRAAATTE